MTAAEALADAHLAARGFLGRARHARRRRRRAGAAVPHRRAARRRPAGPRDRRRPTPTPAVGAARPPSARPPLDGLRLLEVTTAWAGPYVGNMLGALGMDVVKFEALPPFDGYRVLRLHTDSDPPHVVDAEGRQPLVRGQRAAQRGQPQQARRRRRPARRRGPARCSSTWPAPPTPCCATSRPRCCPSSGSASTTWPRSTRGIVVVRMPAFGTVGPVQRQGRLRHRSSRAWAASAPASATRTRGRASPTSTGPTRSPAPTPRWRSCPASSGATAPASAARSTSPTWR